MRESITFQRIYLTTVKVDGTLESFKEVGVKEVNILFLLVLDDEVPNSPNLPFYTS